MSFIDTNNTSSKNITTVNPSEHNISNQLPIVSTSSAAITDAAQKTKARKWRKHFIIRSLELLAALVIIISCFILLFDRRPDKLNETGGIMLLVGTITLTILVFIP